MLSSLCCKLRTAGIIIVVIEIIEAVTLIGFASVAIKEILYLQSDEVDEEHKANYMKTLKALKLVNSREVADFNLMAILASFVAIDFIIVIVRLIFASVLFTGVRKGSQACLTAWLFYKMIDIVTTVILSPIIFFHFHLPLKIKPSYNYITIATLVVVMLIGAWFIKMVYDIRREHIREVRGEQDKQSSKTEIL